VVHIIVRDGRMGRDRSIEGGAILAEFDREQPFEDLERLTLQDGTDVEVIRHTEQDSAATGWTQTIKVGNVWGGR
jgi:hypothetical protein